MLLPDWLVSSLELVIRSKVVEHIDPLNLFWEVYRSDSLVSNEITGWIQNTQLDFFILHHV